MLIYALDIETLGMHSRSLILDIAIVLADVERNAANGPVIKDCLKVRPAFVEQLQLGRVIDPNTVAWHGKKRGEAEFAEHVLRSNEYRSLSVEAALNEVRQFTKGNHPLWINGLSFDPAILRTLCEDIGYDHALWDFRSETDVRTVRKLRPECDVRLPGGVAHDAHKDALWNAQIAYKWYSLPAPVITVEGDTNDNGPIEP